MKISGLTIFLIVVTIMTLFTFGTSKYVENMTRDSCKEMELYESYDYKYCWEVIEFHTVRSRITQYASMILICVSILSFKVDKIKSEVHNGN